jgi:ABC-2 type transport system ATP-binding protein
VSTRPAIEVTGLVKSYGGVAVLRGIDLGVPRGTVCAILGPNGSGKTTTVRILSTLVRADGGTARVVDLDVWHDRHQLRRAISLTGQDTSIDDAQTGEENLAMMGRLAHLSAGAARRRSAELLESLGLAGAGRRRVGSYSGGMRRRLDLAAGLVGRPSVLFLDEPTTGLDPIGRQAIWDVVRGAVSSGVTVLLTTQYLDEADHLADQVAVIDDGRVVAEGSPTQLKAQVMGPRLELVATDMAAFTELSCVLGGRVLHRDAARLTIGMATDGCAAHVRATLDDIDPCRQAVERFAIRDATLDDVFMALTGHGTTEEHSGHEPSDA